MRINSIDSNTNEVNITLNSSELVQICNSMYRDNERKPKYNRLYADFMMIRDLSQYGHVDNWCLEKIVEQRESDMKKDDVSKVRKEQN